MPVHPRNFEWTWYELQVQARWAWPNEAEEQGDEETVKRLDNGELMPRIRLHDLRHLHVSLLLEKGLDPRAIADRVGHVRASFTLDAYSHMFEKQRRAAYSLEDLLEMPQASPERDHEALDAPEDSVSGTEEKAA